jgi:hypothetical protein
VSARGWRLTPAKDAWSAAWSAERERLAVVPAPRREPILAVAGRLLARGLHVLPKLRTAALTVGGFGCLTAAAWLVAVPLGLVAAGVSLLVLEWLTGVDRADGRRR